MQKNIEKEESSGILRPALYIKYKSADKSGVDE